MKYAFRLLLFCWLIGLFAGQIAAQTPLHFLIGEEALSGLEVYTIQQDSNRKIWIGTNDGLLQYDGYRFNRVPLPESALSNDVLGMQKDRTGRLFYYNLSGQIFTIVNDRPEVFLDSIFPGNNNLELYFTKSNVGIAVSSSVIVFDSEGTVLKKYPIGRGATSGIIPHEEGHRFFFGAGEKVSVHDLDANYHLTSSEVEPQGPDLLNAFELADTTLYCSRRGGLLLQKEPKSGFFYPTAFQFPYYREQPRFFSDGTHFWSGLNNGGVYLYNSRLEALKKGELLFEDYFISTAYRDSEGNTLLGTFDQGILVLPNLEIEFLDIANAQIDQIEKERDALYVATKERGLYRIDPQFEVTTVVKQLKERVVKMFGMPEIHTIGIHANNSQFLSLNDGSLRPMDVSAIKTVAHFKDSAYLVGDDRGYRLLDVHTNQNVGFAKANMRTVAIAYDSAHQTVFTGTSVGLKIGPINETEIFRLDNRPIVVNTIFQAEGRTYIGSDHQGILVFEGPNLIHHWPAIQRVTSFHWYRQRLFVQTASLFYELDPATGQEIQRVESIKGLSFKSVKEVVLWLDQVWVTTAKGLQYFPLSLLEAETYAPNLRLDSLRVNDARIAPTSNLQLGFRQNKLSFFFSSPSIAYADALKYAYRLVGLDQDWVTNPYPENVVNYRSLPPGAYAFEVKAVYRDQESAVKTIAFTIQPPYWTTWWFLLGAAGLFVVLVVSIAHFRLANLRRKNQLLDEVNASRLTALKSQMNPHFIFNAINSIQNLILTEKVEAAYTYVARFSQLVRTTLEHSDRDFISLEEEIEHLEVYLKIEQLRFQPSFHYSLDGDQAPMELMIPPMLVQPFVENAIKHGLLHKEGDKHLKIAFAFSNQLVCTIEDNGIGRKASQAIQKRQGERHTSFATKATQKRIQVMSEHYRQALSYRFEDVVVNNEISGTRVVLQIPHQRIQ